MALFNWNVKCVIQVIVVMGVWWYFQEKTLPEWKIDEVTWWLGAVLLIFSVYFGNTWQLIGVQRLGHSEKSDTVNAVHCFRDWNEGTFPSS